MTIDEMRARKRELGLTNEMLSESSGIPLGTVQKIFGGATKAPRKATLDALAKALSMGDGHPGFSYMTGKDRQLYVKGETAAYLPNGPEKGGAELFTWIGNMIPPMTAASMPLARWWKSTPMRWRGMPDFCGS